MSILKITNFENLKLLSRGKVRDLYDLGDNLLFVSTDRISAFDVIMNEAVPKKGEILTQMSLFWFDKTFDISENHLLTADVSKYPSQCKPYLDDLKNRSMIVKKAKPLPIECIVRGYLSGSAYNSYKKSGEICGIKLPDGLKKSSKLNEPIFTPSTKAEIGSKDINITEKEAADLVGLENYEKVKNLSLSIYKKANEIADKIGIIIADTKFEFGFFDDKIILIDEVLTPDSSRFWSKSLYKEGKSQVSFDKQYLRDFLISTGWDKTPPPPKISDEVIKNTSMKYLEILNLFKSYK